jgi:hypothetical protein
MTVRSQVCVCTVLYCNCTVQYMESATRLVQCTEISGDVTYARVLESMAAIDFTRAQAVQLSFPPQILARNQRTDLLTLLPCCQATLITYAHAICTSFRNLNTSSGT